MPELLTASQLTGLDDSHVVAVEPDQLLQPEVATAFGALREDARRAGFDLCIASSYRSFERQMLIWNGKARGQRPIHDDTGQLVDAVRLSPEQRLHAMLRYSALPGSSRHHWGTDMDVYDAAAMPPGSAVALSPQEVAADGVFDPLHQWLDEQMALQRSRGFYRPYGIDRGGVAAERWHLSYASLALDCGRRMTIEVLRSCWQRCTGAEELALRDVIERQLSEIFSRYIAVPDGWCPAPPR